MTTKSRVRFNLTGRRKDSAAPSLGREIPAHAASPYAPARSAAAGRYPGEPERPADLLLRLRNQVDAYVDVTGPNRHGRQTRWRCHGCLDGADVGETLLASRDEANSHAAVCRAVDLAAAPATVTGLRPTSRIRFSGRRHS
ncbi:hypothetical protein ABT039_22825 [Streptomyces lasiicapitis]|uniref:hypothetical protein n=1 Tax=Streptomyces lasiicapitis TaxID=1923961 RepID=UPI0033209B9A